jgi:hypothetical protein
MSSGVRSGSEQRSRYLPVQVRLGLDLRLVDAQQPAGRGPQEPLQARLAGQRALDPGPLDRGELVGVLDDFLELGDELAADDRVPLGLGGVEAQHEPVIGTDVHFLDLHVVLDNGVAALPGQGGPDLGGPGAELLADDVPAALHQGAAVLLRGEAAVGDPDDPGQGPGPDAGADLADQVGVAGVPGLGPDPDRDAVAGDRHPDHDLRQVIT